MIRDNLGHLRANRFQCVWQIGPGAVAARKQNLLSGKRRREFMGQRGSHKFLGYVVDGITFRGHGARGRRTNRRATIARLALGLDAQLAAAPGKESRRIGAGEQDPVEPSERVDRAIQRRRIRGLGKTDRGK